MARRAGEKLPHPRHSSRWLTGCTEILISVISNEPFGLQIGKIAVALYVAGIDEQMPISIVMAVMVMYEEISVATPAKELTYAMRLLRGRMPQLNDVAIQGCNIYRHAFRRFILETYTLFVRFDADASILD